MQYIVKAGDMYVSKVEFKSNYRKDGVRASSITLSSEEIGLFNEALAYSIKTSLIFSGIKAEDKKFIDYDCPSLQLIDFLRKRENKLQRIEQLFKSGVVDLEELAKLVKEDK